MFAGTFMLQKILLVGGVTTHAHTMDSVPSERLEIQTVLGFSKTFWLRRWTPLTVIVTNHTGKLEVVMTHGDELVDTMFTTTYRC